MCFSTPDYPSPPAQPQIVEVPTPVATPSPLPADQRVDKRDLVAEDAERRRAAAREGFEGTWLSKDRYRPKTEEEEKEGLSLYGTSTKQPKTVLRKTFG
jgi:hypothetical protein